MRFHHRLVWIAPSPKGNGRHTPPATGVRLKAIGQPRFSWGQDKLVDAGQIRQRYVEALPAAYNHDFADLIDFVKP